MSYEYAISRVKDALDKSDGNHLKAQRLILNWIEKDHTLLFGLVRPHLQGIISHAVNHAALPPKKAVPLRINLDEEETGELGAAILSGLRGERGEPASFGQPSPRVNKPGKASKAHVDAINKLVSAGKDKGKKGRK